MCAARSFSFHHLRRMGALKRRPASTALQQAKFSCLDFDEHQPSQYQEDRDLGLASTEIVSALRKIRPQLELVCAKSAYGVENLKWAGGHGCHKAAKLLAKRVAKPHTKAHHQAFCHAPCQGQICCCWWRAHYSGLLSKFSLHGEMVFCTIKWRTPCTTGLSFGACCALCCVHVSLCTVHPGLFFYRQWDSHLGHT